MKRIRVHAFGGPEVLVLEDAENPRPGPQEVLIRVKAAGVNPYETYGRAGAYGARNPTLPYTPGSDAAGTVEALGEGVRDLAVGDRVFAMGTLTGSYAELALCERLRVQKLPNHVNFAQGAALFVPYATAYRALFQLARIAPAETLSGARRQRRCRARGAAVRARGGPDGHRHRRHGQRTRTDRPAGRALRRESSRAGLSGEDRRTHPGSRRRCDPRGAGERQSRSRLARCWRTAAGSW